MALDGLSIVDARYSVTIQRATRQVIVRQGEWVVRRMRAAIGRPSTPTPAVSTFVAAITKPIDAQGYPDSPLGPFTIHLAAWSPTLQNYSIDGIWDGLVIHGTNCPTTCLGRDITNGSIRVANADVIWLATHVELGSPAEIG